MLDRMDIYGVSQPWINLKNFRNQFIIFFRCWSAPCFADWPRGRRTWKVLSAACSLARSPACFYLNGFESNICKLDVLYWKRAFPFSFYCWDANGRQIFSHLKICRGIRPGMGSYWYRLYFVTAGIFPGWSESVRVSWIPLHRERVCQIFERLSNVRARTILYRVKTSKIPWKNAKKVPFPLAWSPLKYYCITDWFSVGLIFTFRVFLRIKTETDQV